MKSTKNKAKKGQVSFEFLLVVGFGFTFLIPVLFFFLVYSSSVTDEIVEKQTSDIGYALKKNIEVAKLYGTGSLIEMEVNVPEDLKNISIIPGLTSADPDMIYFDLQLAGGEKGVSIFVDADLAGGINGTCINQGKRLYYVLNNGTNILVGCKIDGTMQSEIDTIYDKIIYTPSYNCGDGGTDSPFEECDDGDNNDANGCNNYCFNSTPLRIHLP